MNSKDRKEKELKKSLKEDDFNAINRSIYLAKDCINEYEEKLKELIRELVKIDREKMGWRYIDRYLEEKEEKIKRIATLEKEKRIKIEKKKWKENINHVRPKIERLIIKLENKRDSKYKFHGFNVWSI